MLEQRQQIGCSCSALVSGSVDTKLADYDTLDQAAADGSDRSALVGSHRAKIKKIKKTTHMAVCLQETGRTVEKANDGQLMILTLEMTWPSFFTRPGPPVCARWFEAE
ncbi:unnamed protein product [Pleuronectes platessa]|uniref:Uncharacterized protein n=1 Tax=Pleuronectes platessa TaxID=8262 RepID=A0A9N7VZH2_PLEPL|nr:unnamed protein product [Pleuronectes platessa]